MHGNKGKQEHSLLIMGRTREEKDTEDKRNNEGKWNFIDARHTKATSHV